ncbi:MAG: biotin/lipoyl-binding protein [Gemmataceae bacterium]|nr:biotin/lipoyl-binding protein [Gemmataceae bacterium]
MLTGNDSPPLGFPQQRQHRQPERVVYPTPLPKRPKGRWFVAALLIVSCGLAGYNVWQAYFRYSAYGTVSGRTLQVAPACDGTVQTLHVRSGDRVRQGQLLLTLDNVPLRHRQAQLADELRMAQANLAAEIAKLKWHSATQVVDRHHGGVAEYYEAWGQLLQEDAKLQELRLSWTRARDLFQAKAIAKAELDQSHYARLGQEQKVAKSRAAVEELKKRMEQGQELLQRPDQPVGNLVEQGQDQLRPYVLKIETLQAEMTRNQEELARCQVHAASNGLVLKVQRFAGEYCKAGEPVVSLLEEGSLEVVLYLPQKVRPVPAVGDPLDLVVDPYPEPLNCTVVRLGDQYEPAPETIKRHYAAGQNLLPVYLQPHEELTRWMALRVGGVVKLPRGIPRLEQRSSR